MLKKLAYGSRELANELGSQVTASKFRELLTNPDHPLCKMLNTFATIFKACYEPAEQYFLEVSANFCHLFEGFMVAKHLTILDSFQLANASDDVKCFLASFASTLFHSSQVKEVVDAVGTILYPKSE